APVLHQCLIAFGAAGAAVACDGGSAAELTCCDLYGNAGGDWVGCIAGQAGLDGNFSSDPLFCDAAGGDFQLHANSPCAEANNPGCGQVGAWPAGCGVTTYAVLPDGTGDFQWIQDALDQAPPGSVVNLVEGVYTGAGNRDLDFGGKALTLRGLPANPEDCEIDCLGAGRGFHFHSGEGAGSVVEGLRVSNGAAALGGGALCEAGSSPTFSAVIFDDCHATDDGGGLLCEAHSSPVLDACLFMSCTAADDGGGLYAHDFSSPALTDGLFRWNEAGDRGGGANFTVNSFPTVTGCIFEANQAANGGGACFVYAYGPVTDCLFWGNTATATAGGLHCYGNAQCTVTRCTFVENAAPAGGGAYCRNNSSPTFANTIIAASTQGEAIGRYADDCNPTLACCDLFDNAGGDWVGFLAPQYGVDGNIAEDPLFCLAGYLDFTLHGDSPCAAENNPGCGQIGAYGVGCAASPDIEVAPGELHFTTGPGGTGYQDLSIENWGGQDLHWFITVSAARLQLPGGETVPVTMALAPAGAAAAGAVATAAEQRETAGGAVFAEERRGEPDTRTGEPVLRGSGGPDGAGYTWIDSDEPGGPAFAWEDITGVGTEIVLGMDDSFPLTLDFTFPFYGVGHTSVTVGSHGYLTFGIYGTDYSNDAIPSTFQPNDYIAPFWDDVSTYYGGSVHFWRDPAADRLIVQWTDVQHYGGSLPYTFQVHLDGDGSMRFQYLDLQGPIASATVGIENPDGTDGLQVAYNTYYLHDGLAVLVRPGLDWLSAAPTSGTLPPTYGQIISVGVDAAGLAPGNYEAALVVTSDDPDEPMITVPVTLDVVSSIVVDPAGGGDYTDIESAIFFALEGMTIELVPGLYTGPGNRDLDYGGKGITIRPQGGRAGECVIDCEGLGRAFTFHSGEDSTSVLEGVTITNGLEWDGGAVACVAGSSPMLRDCVFLDNDATDDGGAVYCSDGSSPVLDHCVLSGNASGDDGGALACQNSSSPQVRYGVFHANQAGDLAGAVHLLSGSAPAICASTFAANTSGSTAAGAFYCWNGSAATLTDCIIAFSDAGAAVCCAGDGPYPVLTCCDVFGNAGGDWTGCIADQADLNGNLCADPRFCDLDTGDLTLAANSPCLPEGNDCGVLMGALGEGCPATPVPEDGVPVAAFLAQNAPNPFNPVTEIRFGLPAPAAVTLTVFDVAGRRVRRLLAGEILPAGVHRVVWQGRDDTGRPLASGVYLYRIVAGDYVATRKMTLLK
ncbi:MAG: right-handed parallel beta-helix repeat-containing protein, partial [Candidatus Krumholzibacteriota bacterium]|nr:right-handed parallel beta-helix repeat-containing protein [Candidatus Krumholzibacteriota bacterium]